MNKFALLLALAATTAFAQAYTPNYPRYRDIGPSNPTSGAATLDSLTVGFVDAGVVWLGNGSLTGPSLAFAGDPNTGIAWQSADNFSLVNGGAETFRIRSGGFISDSSLNATLTLNTGTGAALGYATSSVQMDSSNVTITPAGASGFISVNGSLRRTAGGSAAVTVEDVGGLDLITSTPFLMNSVVRLASSTPTISSGFGTSPSVTAGVATGFRVNVGTGGVATTGVIALGTTATTGWNCFCSDITTTTATVDVCKMTASSTTTVTLGNFTSGGIAGAWVASDILAVNCVAY